MDFLSEILPLIIGAVVALTVALWVQTRFLGTFGYKTKRLLTPNEVDFYNRLSQAIDPIWVILPQVSMGALMDTKLKPTHPRYWSERSKFMSKICDFVICDRQTMTPRLIVELDDVMHDFKKDKLRDEMVAKAGYRTVRFWSRNKPSVAELREELSRQLALHKATLQRQVV